MKMPDFKKSSIPRGSGNGVKVRYKWRWVVSGSVALTCVIYFYSVVQEALEAERTLQAYLLVLDVMVDYLHEHRSWPSNWDEISGVPHAEHQGIYHWPDDIEIIRNRVQVNFDVTLLDVVNMDASRFTAVEQVGPRFGPDQSVIKRLKEAARLALWQQGAIPGGR